MKRSMGKLSLILMFAVLVGCTNATADTEPTSTPEPTVDAAATREAAYRNVIAATNSQSPDELQVSLSTTCIDSALMPTLIECIDTEADRFSDGTLYLRMKLDWSDLERDETVEVQGIKFRASDTWAMDLTFRFYSRAAQAADKLESIEQSSFRTFTPYAFSGVYDGIISNPLGFGMTTSEGIAAAQVGSVVVSASTLYGNTGIPDGPFMHKPNDLARQLVSAGVTHLERVLPQAELVTAASGTPAEGLSHGRFLGDPEAAVDLIVYSDFQCPFCKQFSEQDMPRIVENFVANGNVRIEWRPMPIISLAPLDSPDNESVQAAEAAMCAADQNQYWLYGEELFAAQAAENSGVYSDEMLKQTAADLELDTAAFNECLDSGAKKDEVLELRQAGVDSGVYGTPMFNINDQLVSYTEQGYWHLEEHILLAIEGEGSTT